MHIAHVSHCYLRVVLTDWYIRSGVAGIFSVCLSSEMYQVLHNYVSTFISLNYSNCGVLLSSVDQ